MRLTILHTNDIHSNYENFAKIVTKIRELQDESTLILDAGDFADFKRLELQGTYGLAALDLLESAGYDAIAVGNNETFPGNEILLNMATNSKIPFLSSNLYGLDRKRMKGIHSSIIIKKNNIRILMIGASPDLGPFNELLGLSLRDYIEVIKEEIDKNKGKFDLCILISHLGMNSDTIIAERIPQVQVIIGGHFHILMDKPQIINQTIIFTSGCFAENLGVLKLEVDQDGVRLLSGENINVQECEPCEEILKLLHKNKEVAMKELSKPLYPLDRDLWHDIVEENPITNLLADALRDIFDCDLGIINSGVLNGGIRKGEVTLKKLIEICPSPLNPTYFEMQGKDILEALQNSLDTEYCYKDGKGPGFRGKYLGRLHISNAVIEHDGRNIISVTLNGEKLREEQWYTIASSDYLQRGTGYPAMGKNKNERYRKEYLRDTLRDYICKQEFAERAYVDRWISSQVRV